MAKRKSTKKKSTKKKSTKKKTAKKSISQTKLEDDDANDSDIAKRFEIKRPKMIAFLEAFQIACTCRRASKLSGTSGVSHCKWMKSDGEEFENYRAAFHFLQGAVNRSIEDEIFRRAVKGIRKPIFHKGKQVAVVKEFSDVLLIFLAKASMPHKYRDNTIGLPTEQTNSKNFFDEARENMVQDDNYLDYLRSKTFATYRNTGNLGSNDKQGKLAVGRTSGNGRSSGNGNGKA